MANGILKNLNQSLEITLRDNLDGLKEFTLAMAAASLRPQFELLPVENKPNAATKPQATTAPKLSLLDTQINEALPRIRTQRRAGNAG